MNFFPEKLEKIEPSGIRELFSKAKGKPNVISLGIGAPDINTPDGLKEALKDAVYNNFNNYDLTQGNKEFRDAIVRNYKEDYGIDYNSDEGVIVGCGGVQIIYVALQTYIAPGDEVLLQAPCFLTYPRQVVLAGGKIVWMPSTEDFSIDIEKTKELITDKTKFIFLNFPSNPTGAVMTREELKAIVDLAVDNDIYIVSDEVYEYYTYDDNKHVHVASIDDAYEKTITVNSMSKTFAIPGWRMGFGVTTPEILRPIMRYHTYIIANATTPMQIALANFMHTEEAKEFKKFVKSEFQKRRNAIVDGFNSIDGVKCKRPEGSFYCYANVEGTKYPDGKDFSERAFEDADVVVVPGTEFGPHQDNYIRASFGSVSVPQIEEVVDRLKNRM
ncbi:MAG: pyridoxal phosphate-dependent aminotransferase [Candidatus Heimdallarchaeaceae archaeon]|jgi:aminotransferase